MLTRLTVYSDCNEPVSRDISPDIPRPKGLNGLLGGDDLKHVPEGDEAANPSLAPMGGLGWIFYSTGAVAGNHGRLYNGHLDSDPGADNGPDSRSGGPRPMAVPGRRVGTLGKADLD